MPAAQPRRGEPDLSGMAPVERDLGLWARVDRWIGRARLENAAWCMIAGGEAWLNSGRRETPVALLGFFMLDAVEELARLQGAAWTVRALRELAAQAAEGRQDGFTL